MGPSNVWDTLHWDLGTISLQTVVFRFETHNIRTWSVVMYLYFVCIKWHTLWYAVCISTCMACTTMRRGAVLSLFSAAIFCALYQETRHT